MHLSLPVHAQTGPQQALSKPVDCDLFTVCLDDWELVWKKDLPGQVIRTAENSQTRDIAVAYNVMSRHSATTKVLGIASHHATATEPKTLYELELPGTLGFTSFSIRPHDGALMFAHPNGFHKFHIAKPQGASWSWGGRTADSSCGDDVCVIDGPMADRRPQVSCTVNLLWMDGTDTTQSGVLTLELLLRSRSKASTGSLLLEVHSSNESRVSRCSCNEPDLLHTKHRYKLDASFTANLPAADYLFPRTAYAHSKEHGFSVISIVDLVFMVNHTDALNVTQVTVHSMFLLSTNCELRFITDSGSS